MHGPLPLLDPAVGPRPPFVPPLLVGTPEGGDWVRLADLAQPDVLRPALAAMAEIRGYPDPATIAAGFALIVCGGFAEQSYRAGYGQPVPLLRPEHTWWDLKPSANVHAVAVEEPPEFVEPSRIGEALHLLLDDLYGAIHAETRFPLRAQWAMVTSAIGAWLLRDMPGDPERAVAAADAIYASDPTLRATRPRVTWLEIDGHREAFTTRRVCCFNYRGKGGHYCSNECPVVPAEERLAIAREQLSAR